jgi:ribose 5-phosphate isomerase RpiB
MRLAVVNETSSADKNADILAALDGRGLEIINAGMTKSGAAPELGYVHTGLMSAILLNLKRVDLVVGGCGTGQGYAMASTQYPGIYCGIILSPLDAWLFPQINGGNCISLRLNQEYAWGAAVNLRLIFDALFSVPWGGGYPPHRSAPQKELREQLHSVSALTHKSFAQILATLPDTIINPVIEYPGMRSLIDVDSIQDGELKAAFQARWARI